MSTHYREIWRLTGIVNDALREAANAEDRAQQNRVALGAELRRLRQVKKFSLRYVAKELGVSAPFLSDCELGRRNLTPARAEAYLKVLRPLAKMKA